MTKATTDVQRSRIAEFEAEGKRCYPESIPGAGVVRAFERYLETGDASKICRGLYGLAHLRCGYIAHFDIDGFRRVFADPADFLAGEMHGWATWGVRGERSWHPNYDAAPYVYSDGMTDGEVYAQCCEVADKLADDVLRRSLGAQREREIDTARALAEKHGLQVV